MGVRIRLTLSRPPVGVIGVPGRASPHLMGVGVRLNGPPLPGGTFLWAVQGVKALGRPLPHMAEGRTALAAKILFSPPGAMGPLACVPMGPRADEPMGPRAHALIAYGHQRASAA